MPPGGGCSGGHGSFRQGAMFGPLVRDTLYLKNGYPKAGLAEAPLSRAAGSGRCRRQGRQVALAAWRQVPEAVLERREALRRWAAEASAFASATASPRRRASR